MATEDYNRKFTALLSADVRGYRRLMDDDEEATVKKITVCRDVISMINI